MSDKVSDEMLMAFVDDELDVGTADAIGRAIAEDASLAARAAEFRRSGELARHAFAQIRDEPAPERLVAVIRDASRRGSPDENRPGENTIVAFRPRPANTNLRRMAVAAGLVVSIGAGFLAGQIVESNGPAAGMAVIGLGPVAEALGETAGGAEREIALADTVGRLTTRATYPVVGGQCRSFELATESGAYLGVGCSRGGAWQVELALANGGSAGGYAPASGSALAAVDAYLDSLEAEPALPAGQ